MTDRLICLLAFQAMFLGTAWAWSSDFNFDSIKMPKKLDVSERVRDIRETTVKFR